MGREGESRRRVRDDEYRMLIGNKKESGRWQNEPGQHTAMTAWD
jgi:hypothetical protein